MTYIAPQKYTKAAFGELITTTLSQLIQIENKYSIDPTLNNDLETYSATGGSIANAGNLFRCQTGTSVGGYGVVRSKDNIIYSAGQGVEARFTAAFTTGVPLSLQFGGMFSLTDTAAIGYDGEDFSCLHQHGGVPVVQLITITATGSGSAVVTLDGVSSSGITLTNSDTETNALELHNGLIIDAALAGWRFEIVNSIVHAIARSVGVKAGSFTFAGGGGATATIIEEVAGVAQTKDNIAQADWNKTTIPFVGFDPTKLNVYKIVFGYLGVANIDYFVYNPSTADWVNIHCVEWANANNITHLSNPDMKIGWTAASLGASGTNLTVTGASASMGIQGDDSGVQDPFANDNSVPSVGTSFTPILAIKNRLIFGDRYNLGKIFPRLISISNDHTKPLIVRIYKNATLTGNVKWTYGDEFNSIALVGKGATGYTGGEEIAAFTVPKDGSDDVNLKDLSVMINAEENILIVAKTDSGTAVSVGATSTWVEKK